jgi:hypothetical protein
MRDDDDLPFTHSVLPICLSPEEMDEPVDPDTQRIAFFDITGQIIEHLSAALKKVKEDPWAAVRVMSRGERILSEYTEVGFDKMEPIQRDLNDTLNKIWRMERRRIIKYALTCQPHEIAEYQKLLQEPWLNASPRGPEHAAEDFKAVEKHLDDGCALFDDLHKRRKLG